MFDLIPHRKGATNAVPSFIAALRTDSRSPLCAKAGRESRTAASTSCSRSSAAPTSERPAARTPTLTPIDFESEYRRGNARFRIPLQLFGLGIIDGIQDSEILARHAATAPLRAQLGIKGIPNRSGNDGTITRFGWKAQNKSIAIFAGEAYNVEMGVTNDLFPQATDETPSCMFDKSEPNDITRTDPDDVRNQGFYNSLHALPDWLGFALFMRFLDAPQPAAAVAECPARRATVRPRRGASRASAASPATRRR